MHPLEYKILLLFKKEPQRELSTTEIVKNVFEEEYQSIKESLVGKLHDTERVRDAKRKKGELHRRILYHLNKLVEEGVLRMSNIAERGEKMFCLALDAGDYLIEKKQRRIIISKPDVPTIPIDDYEERGIIRKVEKETWLSRSNAVLLLGERFKDHQAVLAVAGKVFPYVNDAIGIDHVEHLLELMPPEKYREFLTRLSVDCLDFQKEVTLTIDLGKVDDVQKILDFLTVSAEVNPPRIETIFQVDGTAIARQRKIIEAGLRNASALKRKFYLQNVSIARGPAIIGKVGVYGCDAKEFQQFLEEHPETTFSIIGHLALAVDVERFFKEHTSAKEFRLMLMKAAKAILIGNRVQRMNANNYFLAVNKLAEPSPEAIYTIGQNYIRFWNYSLEGNFLDLLASVKDELESFGRTEETIYKSCGIPIRFRLALSSMLNRYGKEDFSSRSYQKRSIRRLKDFEQEDIKKFIEERERLFKVFSGIDRIRFFRQGEYRPAEVMHELSLLVNTFHLPLICYDFAERKGDLSLHQFIR